MIKDNHIEVGAKTISWSSNILTPALAPFANPRRPEGQFFHLVVSLLVGGGKVSNYRIELIETGAEKD